MLHPDECPPQGDLHYLDGGSNFFMTTNMNIDDLRYAVPMTTAAVTSSRHTDDKDNKFLARDALAYAPLDEDVVSHAANLLRTAPLSCVTTRTLPIAAIGGGGELSRNTSTYPYGGTTNLRSATNRVNYAKEKWSSVSFAADKQAVQFHEELTHEILALRRAWQSVNTKVVFPDTVPDEALTYFRPPEKFGQGWEMFDAKKHIDILALDRIALQRQNALKQSEARKERREEASLRQSMSSRSLSRSPSRRAAGSASPLKRRASSSSGIANVPSFNTSPFRSGSGSPLRTSDIIDNGVEDIDVRRLVSDEQVEALFYEDEVAKEIESLKWDFKEFNPPQEWKERHARRMAALSRRAAAWRPLELKREPIVEEPAASRVTSMPAVAPFFSSGLTALDPKLPIPAAMQGSGVSRQQIEAGQLKDAFVIRPDAQKAQKFATKHLADPSSKTRALMAPVVVEGMSWGEILAQSEAAAPHTL